MPFRYRKKLVRELKKYKDLSIRDFDSIDGIVGKVMENIEIPHQKGIRTVTRQKSILILDNVLPISLNPRCCLVNSCKKEGLNLLEVESWLDYISENVSEEYSLEKGRWGHFVEGKMLYQTPRGILCVGINLNLNETIVIQG